VWAVVRVGIIMSVFAAGTVAAPNLKPPPKKDLRLLGEWEVERTGPAGKGERLTIRFTPDGKLKYDDGKSDPEWGWYKVDSGMDPPEIDFATPAIANPASKRKPYLGIYHLDGDTLTVFYAESPRPVFLTAAHWSEVKRLALKRVKKE
jgi:uncharacterized protein (TIGR03067 family)